MEIYGVRPVKCAYCDKPMFYRGQPKHEPEVKVIVQRTDDEGVLYMHERCWERLWATSCE